MEYSTSFQGAYPLFFVVFLITLVTRYAFRPYQQFEYWQLECFNIRWPGKSGVTFQECLDCENHHQTKWQILLIGSGLTFYLRSKPETIFCQTSYIYIYIYIYICMYIQSQVLKKWYLIPPWLTLGNIRNVSRVKWSNPGKGVATSSTPQCKRDPSGHPPLRSPTFLIYTRVVQKVLSLTKILDLWNISHICMGFICKEIRREI